MKFFVTQTFTNRAYRAYSKARARLAPRFDDLKETFQPVALHGEQFDDILVTFVDPAPVTHYREVKNRNRTYEVEIAVPEMPTYAPSEDDALLVRVAEKLREVLTRAPVSEATRKDLLDRFSTWESPIRRQSIRSL